MSPNPPAVSVRVEPESRLSALLAAYDDAKDAHEAAKERLDALTASLKQELVQAAPGANRMRAALPDTPGVTMTYVESWRVDAKRLKAEAPETYVRYAVKSGTWKLERARNGGAR